MPLRVRWMWIVTGLGLLVWIGVEDRGRGLVLGAALLIVFSLVASLWSGLQTTAGESAWRQLLVTAAVGAGAGAVWPLLASLLILIKTSLHAHPVPDFSAEDIRILVKGVPWRAGMGTFIGLGLGVFSLASASEPGQSNGDHFGG